MLFVFAFVTGSPKSKADITTNNKPAVPSIAMNLSLCPFFYSLKNLMEIMQLFVIGKPSYKNGENVCQLLLRLKSLNFSVCAKKIGGTESNRTSSQHRWWLLLCHCCGKPPSKKKLCGWTVLVVGNDSNSITLTQWGITDEKRGEETDAVGVTRPTCDVRYIPPAATYLSHTWPDGGEMVADQ